MAVVFDEDEEEDMDDFEVKDGDSEEEEEEEEGVEDVQVIYHVRLTYVSNINLRMERLYNPRKEIGTLRRHLQRNL